MGLLTPLRLTSIPLNPPLTQASAQLEDNRPSREIKEWRCPIRTGLLTTVAGGLLSRNWVSRRDRTGVVASQLRAGQSGLGENSRG
jgi:hypothetical protein